ncbi:MAG: hypothetical protein U9R32_10695 [Bacteroidota bacterium]|nr:hypothetical protein [Bacteroidota bacterium]
MEKPEVINLPPISATPMNTLVEEDNDQEEYIASSGQFIIEEKKNLKKADD